MMRKAPSRMTAIQVASPAWPQREPPVTPLGWTPTGMG